MGRRDAAVRCAAPAPSGSAAGRARKPLALPAALFVAAFIVTLPACRPAPEAPAATAVEEPAVAEAPRTLHPGDVVECQVAGGETDLYRLRVPAGTVLRVSVEQYGADVKLSFDETPDGEPLCEVDRYFFEGDAEETLLLGAPVGAYGLGVRTWEGTHGRYLLRVGEPVPADDVELRRLAAQRDFACAGEAAARAEEADEEARETAAQGAARTADERFRNARDTFAALGDRSHLARVLFDSGYHRYEMGDAAAAFPALEEAARIYAALGDPEHAGWSLLWAARAAEHADESEHREAALRRVIELLDDHHGNPILASALSNLGKLLSDQGRSAESLAVLQRALDERDLGGDLASTGRMKNLAHLGVEWLRVGDLRRGRDFLERSVALGDELEDAEPGPLALIRSRLCGLYLAEDRLSEARECSTAALAKADAAVARGDDKALRSRALVRLVQGQVGVEAGELDVAREALSDARDVLAEEDPLAAGIAVNGLGWLELEAGDPAAARTHFDAALRLHSAAEDRRGRASSLLGRARAERALGDLGAALRSVKASLSVVEDLRGEPTGRTLHARFLASRHAHYDLQVELLMELHRADPDAGWADRAFLACEHARARSLLDTLNDLNAGEDPATAAAAQDLEEELDELERRRADVIWSGGDRNQLDSIDARISRAELALQRLRSPTLTVPPSDLDPSAAADLRRQVVDAGSLLLSFHLGAERSYVWATDSQGTEVHPLPPRHEIEELALTAQVDLAGGLRSRRRAGEGALRDLGDRLLGAVAARLAGHERVLVVAEGALLYTPFAALPVPGTDRRLIDDHEIVYLPSATILKTQRHRLAGRPPAAGALAMIADPVFGPEDERVGGNPGHLRPPSRRSGEDFGRLPYSRREAEAILGLLPPDAGRHAALLGFDANLEAVDHGALDGYRVIHFATHARVSTQDPESSFILLSRLDENGRQRPGELRSQEIYRLHLPADLVVLSACRTALGEELPGEGLLGFTQGFLAAGAARVVVSLWSVDDRATAELMELFYRALYRDGLSPAAALRSAQRTLRRRADRASPYWWAGFVLQGEPQ